MNMHAITHLNPVLGIDIHFVLFPGAPAPIIFPCPYVGFVFDPMDYAPIVGSSISVHGLPRSVAGTAGIAIPPFHIPMGFAWVPPAPGPANESENFMGSKTVIFEDEPATYMFLPVLTCQSIGLPPPIRINFKKSPKKVSLKKGPKKVSLVKKKKPTSKSLKLPTSIAIPIPAGPPVFIGGAPTIRDLSDIIQDKIQDAALGMALKKLANSSLVRRGLDAFKRARQRIFRNMNPGFLKCVILRAEPVDSVTGEVAVDQEDFSLPGRIPIEWTRHYGSQSQRMGTCGYGWETPADARLEFDTDGSVIFHDGKGIPSLFDALPGSAPVQEPIDGGMLHKEDQFYVVRLKNGLAYHFPIPSKTVGEVLISHVVDRCDNAIQYVRNEHGLKEIRDSSGKYIEVISRQGRIQTMRLMGTNYLAKPLPLIAYTYDENQDLTEVRDALDVPYRFRYLNHCLLQHTDRNGLSFYYEYDEAAPDGRCIHAWGDGGLYDYHFNYRAIEGITEVTDSLGHVTILKYNNRYMIVSETDPLGGVTRYEYDDVGRTTALVGPEGKRTEYQYDERGNEIALVQADGTTITTEFNAEDKPTRLVDPNGAALELQWNAQGLPIKQKSPLGYESHYQYDDFGQLISVENPRKARTELVYDGRGNLVKLTDALGNATFLVYDERGNVVSKRDALGHVTEYQYDAKSRLVAVQLPGNGEIACAYDAEDNLIRYQDENGAVTRLEYFGQGEVKKRIQPDGHTVEYHYDTEENLIAITNQRGERYELKRDALGRITEEIDYWGQSRRYTYTKAGHLKESTDPLGQLIQYKVDPLGRILAKLLPDPANPKLRLKESFEYDGNGNLVACENKDIRIERSFDPEGRMIEEKQGSDCVVSNTYDENDNRIARTTDIKLDGQTTSYRVEYGYDALDQAVSVKLPNQDPIQIRRDALGQIIHERLGTSLQRRFQYSADGYLTSQQVLAAERPLFEQRYTYDKAGNLTEKRDSQFGTDRFTYDPMGHIIEHLNPEGKLKRYLHDPAGDLQKIQVVTKTEGDEQDDKWSREYTFNDAGNLTERTGPDDKLTLAWDANQRLIESTRNGVKTAYRYDPLGRRISKETGGEITRFQWDGDALLGDVIPLGTGEQQATQNQLRQWVYYPETFEPLAVHIVNTSGTQNLIYHNDPNGCPQRVLDERGQVVWAAHAEVWGKMDRLHANAFDNPLRFQGQYEDRETGLHYNRHRYYEPELGMFISQDPLGLAVGENVFRLAPNSLGWIDPYGLRCGKTRFVNGVRVVDRRTGTVMEGTVDLKPTLDRIASGGRFPHRNDGSIFQNRPLRGRTSPELPAKAPGYYHEYVHPTPGISGPGPQRVVVGQGGEMFYTPDHYQTFIPLQ